ncbi:hypothetical protein TIFTF001_014295 [Ficus carica]|uniref:Uncharacterized protein n=1 Tax=Ficus carica TaxID=3494 RepID=A0AA88A5S7_FICCA|nr:hypothetical protein TIFTF001_014295 [Ficus carica]
MGSKHGAELRFRKPLWKPSTSTTVFEDRCGSSRASTTFLQDRRGSAVLPRRSSKTVVKARGFHNGFHLTVVESQIPRTFFINRRQKFVIYFPFTDCCP